MNVRSGHEDQFSPLWLSARYCLGKATFVGSDSNGRDAPIPDLPALASEQGGSTPKPSFAARETSAARESYRSTMPRGSLDCDKLRLSIRAPRWFALR